MMAIEAENRWNVVRQRLARAAGGAAAIALAAALALGTAGCSSGAASTSASSGGASASEPASAGSGASAEPAGASGGDDSGDGSSSSSSSSSSDDDGTVVATEIDESLYDLEYTKRDQDPSYDAASAASIRLAGSFAQSDSSDVSADGSTTTISAEGVYVLSGDYEGQIVVDADENAKVQLVLAGASISNASGSAIYVAQADKCFITLADGTANSVADGASYTFEGEADEPDAAVFSKCDLTIQGSGSLAVDANYNDGIKTKDDLVVTGGTLAVEAKSDGLVGKDSVKIADGSINVKAAEGDGIKSSKDTDENKGFVSIDGGDIAVNAGDKGIKAETYLRVEGGSLDVTSADDALHCDGCGRIDGGDIAISAGDDGIHVEYVLDMNGGTVNIAKSYEGLEGQTITMNGGDVNIVASDDAINAASAGGGSDDAGAQMAGDGMAHKFGGFGEQGDRSGAPEGDGGQAPALPEGAAPDGDAPSEGSGSVGGPDGSASSESQRGFGGQRMRDGQMPPDMQGGSGSSAADGQGQDAGREGFGGGFGGFGGGGMMDADENCSLTINGGMLVVDSGGDGLDSNGSIVMNGGTVYVNGPTSNGDGALDCGTTITSNGGTLVAVGSAGMAEGFTDGTQPFGQVDLAGAAGEELRVLDGSGNAIASFTPTKAYQNVVVSVEGMTEGATYTLQAGSASATFEASTTASGTGFGGGFGGGTGDVGQRQGGKDGQPAAGGSATQA